MIRNISDTALWAAIYRARESDRPDALFRDPLARRLAGERGGEVVEARVVHSSGNPVFDRQAETAVRKAAPLPVPDEPRLMQQMREFNFVFEPES